MKPNWPIKKLEETAEFLDHLRVPLNKDERERRIAGKSQDQLFPYYGATGQVGRIDDYIFSEPLVLLAEDGGPFGTNQPIAYKVGGKFWVNNHAHVLRAKNEIITTDWLYYTLRIRPDVGSLVTGATRPKLNQHLAKTIKILLPSINEQKRIVAKLEKILGKIEEAKKLRKKSIIEADFLFQNELGNVFRFGKFELKRLNEVCQKTTLEDPRKNPNNFFDYIDISSVNNKEFKLRQIKKIVGKRAPSRARKRVNTDDIIFATTRPNLKNISIIPKELNNSIASTGFCILRADKNKILPRWIFYGAISDFIYQQIENKIHGAAYPAVSDKDVLNSEIPLPDINEQERVVKYLDGLSEKVNQLQALQKETSQEFDELQQSVLATAFEGNL